jgi:cyclopropane fatty-acyl-phospholipid synthase-like methyltransferase
MKINYNRVEAIEDAWRKRFPEFDKLFDFKKNLYKSHLDLGCGFGAFLKILADKYPNVKFYGLDVDKDEIVLGKKLYNNKNLFLDRLKTLSGWEKYDTISVFFVLHEIEGKAGKMIRQIRESLNFDGRIFIYDFRTTSKEEFRKFYDKNTDPNKSSFEDEYEEHNKWDLREFEHMMRKSGFRTIMLTPVGDYFLAYIGGRK